MVHISVTNLIKSTVSKRKTEESAKKIITRLRRLKKFPFLKNIDLSIVFLEPEKIRELNKKYRKKDKPTDILSFTIERTKENLIGEILLCPEIIKTKDYRFQASSFRLQVNHLLTHGLLHLCGYDHKTEKQWKNMEKMSKLICYSLLAFAFVLFFISARVVSAVGVIQCLPLKAIVTNDLEVKNDLTVNRNEKILNNLTIDNDVFAAKKIYLGPDNLALYPYITNNAVQGISFYSQGGQNFLWQSVGIDAMVLGNPGAIPPDNGYALRVYGQVDAFRTNSQIIHLDSNGLGGTLPNVIKLTSVGQTDNGAALFHGDAVIGGVNNLVISPLKPDGSIDAANILMTIDTSTGNTLIKGQPVCLQGGAGCPAAALNGSGSVDRLVRWTPTGNDLGNSVIRDDGVNVGIGTASSIELAVGDSDTGLEWSGDGQLNFFSNGNNTISIRSGKAGIGTLVPAYSLDVQGGQINASGGLCINGSCKASWNGMLDGGGTSGRLARFNGLTSLGDSVLYESGSNIGINVNPAISLAVGDADTGLNMIGDGDLGVITNGTRRIRINSSGNVGIGMDPVNRLDVGGDVSWTGALQGGSVPWARLTGVPAGLNDGDDVGITVEDDPQVVTVNNGQWCTGDAAGKVNCTTPAPSFSEVDTLNSVTGRGNTTANAITVGGLTVDTNTLYVDSVNNRVGIGTLAPSYELDMGAANSRMHLQNPTSAVNSYITAGGFETSTTKDFAVAIKDSLWVTQNAFIDGTITIEGTYTVDGGAPGTFTDTTERYIVEAGPVSVGIVRPIDYTTMSRLCRDVDGCEITLAMINWSAVGLPGSVASRNGKFFMSETSNWWRYSQFDPSDVEANDNNGAINEWRSWDCMFTDAETSTNINNGRTDSGLGFGLLNCKADCDWYSDATTSCRVIIED